MLFGFFSFSNSSFPLNFYLGYGRVRSLNNSIVAVLCNSFPTVLPFCQFVTANKVERD